LNSFRVSEYILQSFIARIIHLSKEYIYAEYVILYALSTNKVKNFYEKNGFSSFDAGYYSLRDQNEMNDSYSMFLSIYDDAEYQEM